MARPDTKLKYTQLFINNEWLDSVSKKTFPTLNPCTGEEICQLQEGDQADVDKAVIAARAAFHHDAPWRTMDASERGRYLYKLADLITRDSDYLAALDTLDAGQIISDASAEIISGVVHTMRYYAGWADKNRGKVLPADGVCFAYTRHEPIGICGQIVPWNFPLGIVGMAPALATGNVLVMKPSEFRTLSALHMASLVKEAGFPPGVVNVVPGYGSKAGAAIASHMDIDKVCFTGSNETGMKVRVAAATSNQKRVACELGGKSPLVIFDDCGDLMSAAQIAHDGCMSNCGQFCCSASRTYVHENIYDEFVQASKTLAEKRVIGSPNDPRTEHGPQVSEAQFKKILHYIELGKKEGATLQCGGERFGEKGYFIKPTVFSDVTDDMAIARDEIFGPVQQILKFSTLDEVIDRANDTKYGLAAGIISNDMNKVMRFSQAIRAGSVWINSYNVVNPQSPFGGYKQSGFGRELGGEYAIQEYTEVKCVSIGLPFKCS